MFIMEELRALSQTYQLSLYERVRHETQGLFKCLRSPDPGRGSLPPSRSLLSGEWAHDPVGQTQEEGPGGVFQAPDRDHVQEFTLIKHEHYGVDCLFLKDFDILQIAYCLGDSD